MGGICKINKKDLKYALDKIDYWYKKNIKFLTIITVPFNTSCIFLNIIETINKCDGNILYVWGKKIENKELVLALKENNVDITHSYSESCESKTRFTSINYKNLINLKEKYDLIIFDDVTYFSRLTNNNIREMLEICSEFGKRVLLYGIEKNSLIGDKFELASYNYEQPFVEPRILLTRIDLNLDIPYSLYDYIKWFKDNKNKVIICIPDVEKLNNVYNYFENKLKLTNAKMLKVSKNNEIKRCERVLKYNDKAIFIITNKMEELLECCQVDAAIILFADNEAYNYKRLLYLCGKMGILNNELPEVLFVSNYESEDIEKVKIMARNFNKRVWEKNLRHL